MTRQHLIVILCLAGSAVVAQNNEKPALPGQLGALITEFVPASNSTEPTPMLPLRLTIPQNTKVEARVLKMDRTGSAAIPKDAVLQLWDPTFKSATIFRNTETCAMQYQWEGGHSTWAIQFNGVTYYQSSLKYPENVTVETSPTVLSFHLNSQGIRQGFPGDFPGSAGYAPGKFLGRGKYRGQSVFVVNLAGGGGQAQLAAEQMLDEGRIRPGTLLPQAAETSGIVGCLLAIDTLRPIAMETGVGIIEFSYTPLSGEIPQLPEVFANAMASHSESLR